jgi:hypothetical protein
MYIKMHGMYIKMHGMYIKTKNIYKYVIYVWSRDSVGGILRRLGAGRSPILEIVQTGCRAHPAYCSIGTGVLSVGIKRPGRDIDHSLHLAPRLRVSGAKHLLLL